MASIRNIFILILLLSGLSTYSQDFFPGNSYDPSSSKSTPVFYVVTESHTEKFYFSNFKIYDAAKKKILVEINLTNDKGSKKISYSTTGVLSETKILSYDPETSGLFFCNNNQLNAALEKTSLFNPDYQYIYSFRDTGRTTPTLHKITLYDGTIFFLDPITDSRLARHKIILANSATNQQSAAAEKKRLEEEQKRANELHVADSLEQIKKLSEQKRVADSLKTERFSKDLLEQAEVFYTNWVKDSVKVDAIQRNVYSHYAAETNNLSDTRIENELYSGDRHRRKKQGNGLLVVKKLVDESAGRERYSLSFYDGVFEDDTFQSGNVFLQEDKKTYIGQCRNAVKDGVGWLKLKDGNYLLGNFKNGSFETGISNWSYPEQGKHYFGTYNHDRQTGFGEMYQGKSIYIGFFEDGKLINGYAKDVDAFGNVSYSEFENGKKADATKATVESFIESVFTSKKKIALTDHGAPDITGITDTLSTMKLTEVKGKYKVPHYFGVSLGAAVPFLGFNQHPSYGLVAPKASLDAWFRLANAIGFKLKIGCSTYSVNADYSKTINGSDLANSTGSKVQVRNRYDMLWFAHFYDAGFGLNLGNKTGSIEFAALSGLAVIHQPLYFYPTDKLYWDKGRPTWNFQGEAAIRINCSRTFAFRFGATYFITQASDFSGYAYDNSGFVSTQYLHVAPKKLWIQSIDPFLSFLGLF